MFTLYIAVRTRNPEEIEAYLYEHTTIRKEYGDGWILQTSGEDLARVRYLADYQAGRLCSGLHGARVFDSLDDAQKELRKTSA